MTAARWREGGGRRPGDAPRLDLSRNASWTVGATWMFCTLCMVLLTCLRGGWLDEFWTVWLTEPGLSLQDAFWDRWIRDTPHPPLFSFLVWLFAPFTGDSLTDRRLINALALVIIVPTAILCLGRGKGQVQPVLFGVAMCSSPYFIAYFAEHRSYFLGLAAMSCFTATVRQCHMESWGNDAPARGVTILWLFVTAMVTINIHYMLAIMACILLGCAAVYHWLRAQKAMAIWFVAAGVAASLPLLILASIAFGIHATPAAPAIPFAAGLFNMALVVAVAVLGNLAILACAAATGVRAVRDWKNASEGRQAQISFIGIILAALVIIAIVFSAIEAVMLIMAPRQFLGTVPIIVALLCEIAAIGFVSSKTLLLACVNAIIVAGVTTAATIANHRWEFNAGKIEQVVKSCPTTRVLALDPFSDQPAGNLSPGAHEVASLGYRLIGEKYGFDVEHVPSQTPTRVEGGPCPTIVWMEHNFFHMNPLPSEVVAQAALALDGVTVTKLEATDGHLLMHITPPRSPDD